VVRHGLEAGYRRWREDAIAYFMPDLDSDRDTSREVSAISGMELPVKDSDSDKGMLVSDVFLNVPVKGGEDWNVACLVEQQHEPDWDFAGRIFGSWIRLRASRPTGRATAFAIYTGDSKDVNFYTESCYGVLLCFGAHSDISSRLFARTLNDKSASPYTLITVGLCFA
jgi:hypothetical protein